MTRIDAIDLVKTLAAEGKTAGSIHTELEKQGAGGLLDLVEVESIVTQVNAAMNMVSRRPSRVWPRLIGVIAVVFGLGGIALGGGPTMARYSPATYGLVALIFGLVLIIKPGWGSERVK